MNGKKVVLAIGFFGALLVAALYLGLNPGNLAALAIGGAVPTWRNRKRKKRDSAFWSSPGSCDSTNRQPRGDAR